MDDLIVPDNEFMVIVTGSRDYADWLYVHHDLDFCYDSGNMRKLVHGRARGADTYAAQWGAKHAVKVHEFSADWDMWGKSAGMRRNRQMVEAGVRARAEDWMSVIVLAYPLPNSVGTFGMMRACKQANLPTFDRHR